jgi:hypothetical protein
VRKPKYSISGKTCEQYYYGRQKKVTFSKKSSPGIKRCNFFSIKDRTKIQTDLSGPLQMLLKSLAVDAFKINFQGFFIPPKNLIFSKIQKLSKIPQVKTKNIIALHKAQKMYLSTIVMI